MRGEGVVYFRTCMAGACRTYRAVPQLLYPPAASEKTEAANDGHARTYTVPATSMPQHSVKHLHHVLLYDSCSNSCGR
jgi:hypothetical protein